MALMIKLTPCNSKMLAGHGYDQASQTLAVRFASGGTYHYIGVPPDVYEAMCSAESMGRYFHQSIRGTFHAERVNDETDDQKEE
jgi:hypothetical protein